ncbi:TPA: helix-turn-helix transcriptional regulator [Morganella morganii]|nr:helix-turn-helix transcriptional regulator [Morganella morganii]
MKNITANQCVGKNIRTLRLQHGMSTRSLAIHMNISQQQLCRYERGVNKIHVCLIYRLHIFFNVSIDVFFNIDSEIK